MGKKRPYGNGESSSNQDFSASIIPKPETLDFGFPSDVMYSSQFGDNVASSSRSNVRSFLTGMGFGPSLVDKVIEDNGEDNVDLLLEILMECSDNQKSNFQSSDSMDGLFGDKEARNNVDIFSLPKEEPDMFDDYEEKRESLLKMNFTEEEVDFAMEKLGMDAPVDEIVDFITASQIATKCVEETDDAIKIKIDEETADEEISNEVLFGAMEKTLQLLEMGFSENEISAAVDRFGSEVPVVELANLICAEQLGETYTINTQRSSKPPGIGPSGNVGSSSGVGNKEFGSVGIEVKPEDIGQELFPLMGNLNMEEIHRGKRPKEEDGGDYTAPLFDNISHKKKDKGKRPRPELAPEISSIFEPTWEEEKIDPEAAPFGIPGAPKPKSCKALDRMVAKPPYFFYGNVATVTYDTWSKVSKFLYGIEAEFVNTQFFSALGRTEGYIHNLPTENRFHILPKPPLSLEEAVPHTKKWWPVWDTRRLLSNINCQENGISQLCDKLRKIILDSRGSLSYEKKREILGFAHKYNLIWVGPKKLGPIDPDYIEIILGYPLNHSQASGISLSERLHMLRHSFQIDTLAYHLSVLKSMYPEGITMLSIFTGSGGAEVALHRLGVHMKGVVSVERCETKRNMLKTWWASSGQTGKLEQIEDIQKLTSSKIDKFIEQFGGFDFIICQSSCTVASQNPKLVLEGNAPSPFDFTLFCEFVRVLQRVRGVMERKRLSIS